MALRNSEIIAAELLGNACANNANVREEMGKLGAVRLVVRLLRRVAGGPACVHPRIIHRLFAIPRICLCLLIRFLVRAPTNDLHLAGDGNEGSGEACRIARHATELHPLLSATKSSKFPDSFSDP